MYSLGVYAHPGCDSWEEIAAAVRTATEAGYVSCRVPKEDPAPPFRLYLLYQMAAAALTLGAHPRPKVNEDMIHWRRPVGCLWDWWKDSNQRATAMMMARICPSCWTTLNTHGDLTDEAIVAGRQILEYVRRTMLGRCERLGGGRRPDDHRALGPDARPCAPRVRGDDA